MIKRDTNFWEKERNDREWKIKRDNEREWEKESEEEGLKIKKDRYGERKKEWERDRERETRRKDK